MGEFTRVYKTDLTDRQIMDFWVNVRLARRDRTFAYCLPKMEPEDFVQWMRKPDVHPWAIVYRGVPVGLCLLTNKEGSKAEVHFCVLPVGLRRYSKGLSLAKAAGLFALSKALWEKDECGGYTLDTLVGVTPVSNKPALKYAIGLGGEVAARIQNYCWYHDKNRNVDGVFTIFNRNNVPREYGAL